MATKRPKNQGIENRPITNRDRYTEGVRSFCSKRKESKESELDEFDWFNFNSTAGPAFVQEYIHVANENISDEERKLRMLRQLSRTCLSCSMCELGLKCVNKSSILRDPHVFSNMSVSRIMIISQSPSWKELEIREPFVNDLFNSQIIKNDLTRDDFYISSLVKCYCDPITTRAIDKCIPFLQMEINLLDPIFIVAVGEVVFCRLCPNNKFNESVNKLVSSEYNVKVFATNDPSCDRDGFYNQIDTVCKLVKALKR